MKQSKNKVKRFSQVRLVEVEFNCPNCYEPYSEYVAHINEDDSFKCKKCNFKFTLRYQKKN